jgi:hypothetical protein
MGRIAIMFALCLAAAPAFAADKESPDYLRRKHAGVVGLDSEKPVSGLYPLLLEAARKCWVGSVAPGVGTGAIGGAVGTMSSARRVVFGELARDRNSAVVDIQVQGFFGATKTNFLQVDLASRGAGSHVDVYYRNNVSVQRKFPEQVRAWITGDPDRCDPEIQRGMVQ